jgi:hypothetical protein
LTLGSIRTLTYKEAESARDKRRCNPRQKTVLAAVIVDMSGGDP